LTSYVTADLNEDEGRAIEAQYMACDDCFSELNRIIEISALLYEVTAAERTQRAACRRWWPRRWGP
jgi:hypothetical protein